MDPSRYSRLNGSNFGNPLTRSEGFWMDQNQGVKYGGRPAPEDIDVWKQLVKSQANLGGTQPQNAQPKSLAMTKKAPLPEIGSNSPRSNASNHSLQYVGDTEVDDEAIEKELCFKKSSKHQKQDMRKPGTFLGPRGLSSSSFDVFPSDNDMNKRVKNTRLRPLGIDRLSSVPEGRGPSAFHTRQLPPMEQDIPERPHAPTPVISPRNTAQARVATPRSTHRRRDYSLFSYPCEARGSTERMSNFNRLENVAPAPSPECGISHNTVLRSRNRADMENIPPADHEKGSSRMIPINKDVLQTLHSQNIDPSAKSKDFVHGESQVKESETHAVQNDTDSSSLTPINEQSSQNKRPSPQDNDLVPSSDSAIGSPLNKRRSYLEIKDMYHSQINNAQSVTHGGEEQPQIHEHPETMTTSNSYISTGQSTDSAES